MARIQDFINSRHKYKVDATYQRPPNAWSSEDNRCLIDTILRGEPMPVFFLNYRPAEGVYYIVDGQQRLNAIKKFHDNGLKLNKKFSGEGNHGRTFNAENPINDNQRKAFLDYKLTFWMMEDYDDERVRLIFSRLQRGKPLRLGERLNAMPGQIVQRMREIAQHPFMKKSIGVYKGRYGVYPDAARIMFYEKYGAKQCGSNELYRFFDDYREMPRTDRDFNNAMSILGFLEKCFPPDPGDYAYLERHAWVFGVYTMIRDLRVGYSLLGKENDVMTFVEDFHRKVYSEDFRNSSVDYQRFYDHVRGGWSERIVTLRRNILIREFLRQHRVEELGEKRQISDEEKVAAYARQQTCEHCGRSFKDFREPEYHHKVRYADGGKSELDNIAVLCEECHDLMHGKAPIELPSVNEYEDDEDA